MKELKFYEITDLKTGLVLGIYKYKNRNRARQRAEKLNLKYGGYRYTAKPILKEE